MKHKNLYLCCMIPAILAWTACNSKPVSPRVAAASRTTDGLPVAVPEPPPEKLPHADPRVPPEQYENLDRTDQVAALYYAVSGLPVDYEKMATLVSQDYRGTTDEFHKRELMQALKPAIDASVAKYRLNKYFWVSFRGVQMDHYDFSTHAFPLRAPWIEEGAFAYFGYSAEYTVKFSNGSKLSRFTVEDETTARLLESRVSHFDAIDTAQVYLFAQGVDMNANRVKCEITRVSLVDRKKNGLGELKPRAD